MNWLLTALLLALSGPAAQTPDEYREALTGASAKLEALADATSEEELARKQAYAERVRLLESLIATQNAMASLESEADLAGRRSELEAELEQLRGRELPTELTLESTEDLAQYEQSARATAAASVLAVSRAERVENRRRDAETEQAGLSERGEDVRARSDTLTTDDDITRYRLDSARLEARLIEERSSYLTAALAGLKLERPILDLELERAKLLDAEAQRLAEFARAEATRLRDEEAQETREAAEEEARRARRESDPLERFRYQARAEAGNLNAESKAFEGELEQLAARLASEGVALEALKKETAALNQRLELRPRDVDTLLRRHLDRSKQAKRLIDTLTRPDLEAALDANQEALATVLDRQWTLGLPNSENEVLAALVDELGEGRADEASLALRAALEEDGLFAALQERADQLQQADDLYAQLLTAVQQRKEHFAGFVEDIEAKMLWTRSDAPLGPRVVADVLREIGQIPAPYLEGRVFGDYFKRLGRRFPTVLMMLALVGGLFLSTRRLARWREIGAGREGWARWAVRAPAALAWALGPAAQLWAVAWAVRSVGGPDAVDPPLATLLEFQAAFVLARRTVTVFLGPRGFLIEWRVLDAEVGAQLVRCTRIITLAGQMLYAPYRVLVDVPFKLQFLPRLLYMVWALLANVAILILVRRRGAMVRHWTVEGGFLRAALRFLRLTWMVLLVPLLALDALGYRVGVERSMLNALKIFAALFLLGALFRVLERVGLMVAKHFSAGSERPEVVARATKSLVRVSAVLIVILVGLGLRYSWGIGGPLAKLFLSIELTDIEPGVPLTLWDVWIAVVWLAVGHLLSVNLRNLHEILVAPFEGTTRDEGNRYAFLAVARYAVIGIAYAGALLTVGFSFKTLGWFATATSVGLGFGLQEIVANFISGLILLFERPIRVGDIVSIGSTSGTVDSISMRATVVTNWERQTIIVPNKKFITENLTNWTRNDKIMRRELDVRVAYGTDVERVIKVTDEVVRAHPAVLEDPGPRIWFQAFGMVGIEFKVLFFTSIDQGLSTRSEIHRAINARFVEEGIQIPSVSPEDLARIQQEQRDAAR